jgi:hypothetical protein
MTYAASPVAGEVTGSLETTGASLITMGADFSGVGVCAIGAAVLAGGAAGTLETVALVQPIVVRPINPARRLVVRSVADDRCFC